MKNLIQGISSLLLLAMATGLAAQTPVYFFYDPACVEQLEYERVSDIDDLAHTDYYSSVGANKQLIVRVQRDPANLNRTLVAEIPEKPYICGSWDNVPAGVIRDINNNRRLAYMVVQMGNQYALYNVYSVATLESTKKGLVYTDPVYGFTYQAGISKPGEILNRGKNKERNVFYETQTTTGCLPTYEFKIISRHIETPIKHLTFVNRLGFQRLYTAQGGLRLVRVNGLPVAQVIAARCNGVGRPVVVDNNPLPTTTNKPGIPDTAGLSPVEKKLWLSRQSSGQATRPIVAQPIVTPPSSQQPSIDGGLLPSATDGRMPVDITAANQAAARANLLPGGIYIVHEKENLYQISEKFGIRVERLVTINNLQGYELGLNQPLKVIDDGSVPVQNRNPVVEITDNGTTKTTFHVVEQGDTLYGISKRYGITLKDVYLLNPSLTDASIDINQRIVVGYQPI
jgi:LysM repeat protein